MSVVDEPATDSGGGLVRLRVELGYDGTDFAGWARQPGQRTVEATTTTALATALRLAADDLRLTVAGRTDAGVHARGQVAHVDVPAAAWAAADHDRLAARLRGLLPDDVRIGSVGLAPAGFDARFSASFRRYEYRLCDSPAGPDPLHRGDVVAYRQRLGVAAMREASPGLLGEHDFVAFCRPRPDASTVRTLQQLDVDRVDDVVVVTVRADAFCHHLVRALVGALVAVGDGRRPASWPAAVLAAQQRDSAVTVMPAHGLVLVEVGYPPDAELAEQAGRSRVVRGPSHAS
jgi:tRNA pseudouridine38-40 synthase